jgi:hypothetical protein
MHNDRRSESKKVLAMLEGLHIVISKSYEDLKIGRTDQASRKEIENAIDRVYEMLYRNNFMSKGMN